MNNSPQAQEGSWFFILDTPVAVRCLHPVLRPGRGDASSMPVVLLSDQKTGSSRAFDSKLQCPCSEPMPTPEEITSPPFSLAAFQQESAINKVLSLCVVETNAVWAGWSSGHIAVYRMHLEDTSKASSNASTPTKREMRTRERQWEVVSLLHEHRAAVHLLATGPSPWVFSASHDMRLIQWHAKKLEPIRDLTRICRLQEQYRASTIKMICMAMGCSCTTNLSRPQGHFVLFFSTEQRALYAVSLGGPQRANKIISDDDILIQRIASARPAVTSAAVLVGDGEDDAAAVICLGDDEGTISFTPLTVVYNTRSEKKLHSASSAPLPSFTSTSSILSDAEYMRAVCDATLTADTLHINRGRVTALSVLSAQTDRATGHIRYCLTAASSKNTITIFAVDVSPVFLGGHVTRCTLLSALPTESPVTSVVPLFPPVRQSAVAVAFSVFSDGSVAALFQFQNTIMKHGTDNHTAATATFDQKFIRSASKRAQPQPQIDPLGEALQEQLRVVLDVVSETGAVVEEADRTLEEQRHELRHIRAAKDTLADQVTKLLEALNRKSAEVVTLKQKLLHMQERGMTAVAGASDLMPDSRRCHQSSEDQREAHWKQKEEEEEEGKHDQQLGIETERDRIQSVLHDAEARFESKLETLRRENRFLSESLEQLRQELRMTREKDDAHSVQTTSDVLQDNTAGHVRRNESSLRRLLEQALGALDA
ncbi:hypothetical protein MOQ_003172 [Trypanosoma cruzi marinkellei]|uniref:Uncharacterized protein n=1 Tax=Trypanosoma cruzi marinkellei TaxID=85056 RepID=K2NDH9_TRYCR|nr:hypothetical protein MOQ_003172 [Trypanosoma cruzi marinkellei]